MTDLSLHEVTLEEMAAAEDVLRVVSRHFKMQHVKQELEEDNGNGVAMMQTPEAADGYHQEAGTWSKPI